MGHYMFRASYTTEGMKGLKKEGAAARTEAVRGMVEKLGGQLEALYWAFGDDDVFVIVELPDSTTAAAVATAVGVSGTLTTSTTVLITADEMDAALKLDTGFRAPGA